MARPGKWDKAKPEALRMIKEGFTAAQIRKHFPGLPKATLAGWFDAVNNVRSEKRSEPIERLPIDPESPFEWIRQKLRDAIDNPTMEGATVVISGCNVLLKTEQAIAEVALRMADLDNMSSAELEKIANAR